MKKQLLALIPEIQMIGDAGLRKKTEAVWQEAVSRAGWTIEDLTEIPFTLLIPGTKVSLIEHTRAVALTSLKIAEVLGGTTADGSGSTGTSSWPEPFSMISASSSNTGRKRGFLSRAGMENSCAIPSPAPPSRSATGSPGSRAHHRRPQPGRRGREEDGRGRHRPPCRLRQFRLPESLSFGRKRRMGKTLSEKILGRESGPAGPGR